MVWKSAFYLCVSKTIQVKRKEVYPTDLIISFQEFL